MQIFLILAFSIAVLFSDDKLLFKGLVDNNYTLIKENLNKENINKDFSKVEFLKEIEFGELGKTRKIRNDIHAMQKISIGIEKNLVLLAYFGASRPLGFYIFINEFKDRPFDEKILDLFFEFKPDLNYRTEGYTTPMQLVITSDSISDNDTKKIIERMLKSGIDVNYDLSFNHELASVSYTMLDIAYANIKKETAKFLKANGGEIKETSYPMISVSKAWRELKNDEFFLDEFIYWGKKGKIPNKDYDTMIKFCQREKYQSCIDKINQIKIATLPLKEFESLHLSNATKMASESQSAEPETSNNTSKIKVYAIQTGGGSDVEKEFRELAEFSGGEYVKLENDSDVAQIILNIIEHGSVDLGKSYELDFSSEKNSQIIANEYDSIVINDELENLIFNFKNNDLIIKHPKSGTQAIKKDFLAPNNKLSKIKIHSEILEFSQIKELGYAQSGKDSVIYAKSSEGDFSLNDNISVFFSSDKNTATNITINNKKDNYIISSLKDDNITLGFGNDTFIYKGGRDSLKNSGGNDRVVFENISFNSAKFSKENYNLKISLGASNELVVGNYFKEGKIENFQFSDKELKSDEIDLLI
ncbi:MAG: hypothetical protein SPJ69_03275 [Campylobacter sp.]|uniref:hypothetical protein n=1 Tax=Campylobacter sp. TaxID=205 RepID=UPI0029702781|nr:hypothetical protein [Campylobacter sp.]MDD7600035.1 hypothetical protein [Campylobacteraceae bacterium]MDY5887319.1 hypothetical protein [Campylobacter sp.]